MSTSSGKDAPATGDKQNRNNKRKKNSKGSSFIASLPSQHKKRRQSTLTDSIKRSKSKLADSSSTTSRSNSLNLNTNATSTCTGALLARSNSVTSAAGGGGGGGTKNACVTINTTTLENVANLKRNPSIDSTSSSNSGASFNIPATSGIRYHPCTSTNSSTTRPLTCISDDKARTNIDNYARDHPSKEENDVELFEQILFKASQQYFNSQSQKILLEQEEEEEEGQKGNLNKDAEVTEEEEDQRRKLYNDCNNENSIIDLSVSSQEQSQQLERHRDINRLAETNDSSIGDSNSKNDDRSSSTAKTNDNQVTTVSINPTNTIAPPPSKATTQSSQLTSHSLITTQTSNANNKPTSPTINASFEEYFKTTLFNKFRSTFESESIKMYKQQIQKSKDENFALTLQIQSYEKEIKQYKYAQKHKQEQQDQKDKLIVEEYETKIVNYDNENKSLHRQVMKLQLLLREKDKRMKEIQKDSDESLISYKNRMHEWLKDLGFQFNIRDEKSGDEKCAFKRQVLWILNPPPPVKDEKNDSCESSKADGDGSDNGRQEGEHDDYHNNNDDINLNSLNNIPAPKTSSSNELQPLISSSPSTRVCQPRQRCNNASSDVRMRYDNAVQHNEGEEKSHLLKMKPVTSTDSVENNSHVRHLSMSSSPKINSISPMLSPKLEQDDHQQYTCTSKAFSVTKVNCNDQKPEKPQVKEWEYAHNNTATSSLNDGIVTSSSAAALDENIRRKVKVEKECSLSTKEENFNVVNDTSDRFTDIKRKDSKTPWKNNNDQSKRFVTPGSIKSKANADDSYGQQDFSRDSSKRDTYRSQGNSLMNVKLSSTPSIYNQHKKKIKKGIPIRDVSNNQCDSDWVSSKSKLCQSLDDSNQSSKVSHSSRLRSNNKEGTRHFRSGESAEMKLKKGKTVKYQEVVRGKKAREKLRAFSCPECDAFLDAVCNHPGGEVFNRKSIISTCSRHRASYSPPKTPDDFWDMSFVDERKEDKNCSDDDDSQF